MEPLQKEAFDVDQHGDDDEDLKNNRRHFLDPLDGRIGLVDITLDEGIGHDGLRRTDMRPAAAERIARDLRHRE